jgi:2'-5' RNA ligase
MAAAPAPKPASLRLFVAVWPPAHAVRELADVVDHLRALTPGLRWVRPDAWHLTLAFLGQVDPARRAELERRLARAAGRHPAATLRLRGGGRFGNRVLYTRLDGDVGALRLLAASVGAAARRTGLDVEQRDYRAHLTLARSGGDDLRPAVAALADFEGTFWSAEQIQLIRSRLGAGPNRSAGYEALATWPLSGR